MRTIAQTSCLALSAVALISACGGGSGVKCGEGTTQDGKLCVVSSGQGGAGTAGSAGAAGSGMGGSGNVGGGPMVDNPPTFDGVAAVAPASDSALLVAWTAATDDVSDPENIRYNIYVATTSGMQNFGVPQATAPAGATSFTLTNLPGDEHFVVVRAVDGAGQEETNTTEQSGTPGGDTTAPTFAGATGATPEGAGEVRVSWDPATDDLTPAGAMSYMIFWAQNTGESLTGTLGTVTEPGATSGVVSGLPAADADFVFHVKAVDAAGNVDDNMAEVAGRSGADTTPPTFAGCRAVGDPGASSAPVVWDAARDDVSPEEEITYRVYAVLGEISDGDPLGEPQEFVGVTSGEVRMLSPSATYSIVCRAVDAAGNEDDNYVIRLASTKSDGEPPTFGGVTDVTVGATDATVVWDQATDDQSDQSAIQYAIYQGIANVDGMGMVSCPDTVFDFDTPTEVSPPGVGSHRVDGLDPNTDYCWIARARDEANNEDANSNTVSRKTFVSFEINLQEAIFNTYCNTTDGCHTGSNPPQGLRLDTGFSYDQLVDATAVGTPNILRVDTSTTDENESLLFRKIANTGVFAGNAMPPPSTGQTLTQEEIDLIRAWINQGAQRN